MELFRFDGVKNKLTSKIAELMYPQWMEGSAESCALLLLTPCQVLTDVSWARAHSQHSVFRVNFQCMVPLPVYVFLSCGR